MLRTKRKALHQTRAGRLALAVPESEDLLERAFAQGESAASQTSQLLRLLDLYGVAALRRAIREALERNTPRASSVAFLLRRHLAPRPCRRWISAAIRRRRRWMSVLTIWRLTMNSPTRATTTPSNSLPAQLEQIGLHAVAGEVDDFLARATKQRWSPRQMLEHLAQTEAAERAHRSLERRLRLSEIKKFKPMADFNWSWPTKIERDVIERALTLDFLPEARNLILVGTNGLGKTMIAQNICHQAVLAGHSVLFRSAAALLEELHRQTPEGRHRKLRTYANVGLLCVDEVGYFPSTISPPTYSTKSSTGVTNENR